MKIIWLSKEKMELWTAKVISYSIPDPIQREKQNRTTVETLSLEIFRTWQDKALSNTSRSLHKMTSRCPFESKLFSAKILLIWGVCFK